MIPRLLDVLIVVITPRWQAVRTGSVVIGIQFIATRQAVSHHSIALSTTAWIICFLCSVGILYIDKLFVSSHVWPVFPSSIVLLSCAWSLVIDYCFSRSCHVAVHICITIFYDILL